MVLQLCGRVCRRLSLWNPNLKRLGFFLFIGTTCSPNGSVRRLCLARSANVSGLLEKPVSVETGIFVL
jgi:hypothetical protein